MKFLDLNGLKHLWAKIKASFDTAFVISSKCENNLILGKIIPFVANHQVIKLDTESNNNVYDWFQKASKGGTLEVFFIGREGASVSCLNNDKSYMRKMNLASDGPFLDTVTTLNIQYNNYARLIKMDDDTLLVVEYVQNK
jgi:hypothetical protein